MNRTWNLEPLYPSFDSELFHQDFELLENKLDGLESIELGDNLVQSIEAYINALTDIYFLARSSTAFC